MRISEDNYFGSGTKVFRDPVHRADIHVSPYELQVINTESFQRLRGVKQLGPCEVVWHGATHTRFQHSLGTLFITQRIIDHFNKHNKNVPFPKIIVARLFALLHDIGHLPFGHSIEDERPALSTRHSDWDRISKCFESELGDRLCEIEQEILNDPDDRKAAGLDIDLGAGPHRRQISTLSSLIIELICGCKGETDDTDAEAPDKLRFYLDVVGNTVCADLFDYLRRDAYNTGLRRDYDDRILSHLQLVNNRVVLDLLSETSGHGGARSELMNLMRVRYNLTERVYLNKTKMWAAGMISKAVELAGLDADELINSRDDDMLWLIENYNEIRGDNTVRNHERSKLSSEKRKRPWNDGEAADDEEVQLTLRKWEDAWQKCRHVAEAFDPDGASALVKAYKRRGIFRPVYSRIRANDQWQSIFKRHFHDLDFQNARQALEAFIAYMAGLDPWQVIICCPNPRMNLKFAAPLVGPLAGAEPYRPLSALHAEMEHETNPDSRLAPVVREAHDVCAAHAGLWRLEVVIPPESEVSTTQEARARGMSEFLLGGENVARRAKGKSVPLESIRYQHAKEAIEKVYNSQPTAQQVEHLCAESLKDHEDKSGVQAYFREDFVSILQNERGDTTTGLF